MGIHKDAEQKTDSFLLRLRNRKYTALKVGVGILALLAIGAALGFWGSAYAHCGALAKSDSCHRWNAVGERHAHVEGTCERLGPCVSIDGETMVFGGNAICAEERAAVARNYDAGWIEEYHVRNLVSCIQDLPDPNVPADLQ